MKKITYEEVNGCHICTSHTTDSNGYPQVGINRKRWQLHRYVYTLHNGSIPEGLVIRHTCDVKNCINPDHLIVGTVSDNARDASERGLTTRKLTPAAVVFIKSNHGLTKASLAKIFGVNPCSVGAILRGRSWTHIQVPA
jgi:HNH endonuclease